MAAVVIMVLLILAVLGVVIYYIYKWVTRAFDTVRFRIQYKFYQHDKDTQDRLPQKTISRPSTNYSNEFTVEVEII